MRHRIKGKQLNRRVGHRKALFKNLVISLIDKGQLVTTEARSKAVKGLVDKLMVRAKQGTVQARRILNSFFNNKTIVNKLVDEVASKHKQRASGFTRIVRLGQRRGDGAMMVRFSFVDEEVVESKGKEKREKEVVKKRRQIKQYDRPERAAQAKQKQVGQARTRAPRTTHK